MSIARKLIDMEKQIDTLIQKHEETLALVKRRGNAADVHLINSITDTLAALSDAHVYNTDARSFERAGRKN